MKSSKVSDSKLYYTNAFTASDNKNWIKNVSNCMDSRKGKSGMPLSYVICPADDNPMDAQDEYTPVLRQPHSIPHSTKTISVRFTTSFKTFFSPRQTEQHGLNRQVSDGNGKSCPLVVCLKSIQHG
jgi:hypothetical protein